MIDQRYQPSVCQRGVCHRGDRSAIPALGEAKCAHVLLRCVCVRVLCVLSCALLQEACPVWMEGLVARKHTVESARQGECQLVDNIVRPVVAERVRYLPTSLHITTTMYAYVYISTGMMCGDISICKLGMLARALATMSMRSSRHAAGSAYSADASLCCTVLRSMGRWISDKYPGASSSVTGRRNGHAYLHTLLSSHVHTLLSSHTY